MVSKYFTYRIKLEVNIQKVKLNCGNTFKKNGVKGKTNLKLYYFRKKDQVTPCYDHQSSSNHLN